MDLEDVLLFLIERRPGRSESELAQAVFADVAHADAVSRCCRSLIERGLVVVQTEENGSLRYYPLAL